MPGSSAEFHEEGGAEYDAAFDWYLEHSPDAAVRFDAEVDRGVAQIVKAPQRWAAGSHYSQVLAQTVSFHSDLPGTHFSEHSDRSRCPHQPEAWVLEAAAVAVCFPSL
jgi:plasmid stabilization system protein ParE